MVKITNNISMNREATSTNSKIGPLSGACNSNSQNSQHSSSNGYRLHELELKLALEERENAELREENNKLNEKIEKLNGENRSLFRDLGKREGIQVRFSLNRAGKFLIMELEIAP